MSDMTPSPPSNRRRRGYQSNHASAPGNLRQNGQSGSAAGSFVRSRNTSAVVLPGTSSGVSAGLSAGVSNNATVQSRSSNSGTSAAENRSNVSQADNRQYADLSLLSVTARAGSRSDVSASACSSSVGVSTVCTVSNGEISREEIGKRNSESLTDFNDAVENFDEDMGFGLGTGEETEVEESEQEALDVDDLVKVALARPNRASICGSLPDVFKGTIGNSDRIEGQASENQSTIHGNRKNAYEADIGDDEGLVSEASLGDRVATSSGHHNNHTANDGGQPLHNAGAVARSHALGLGAVGGYGYAAVMGGGLVHNWQATKLTLKDRFSFMFCNEILSDVHFIVGRGDQRQRIPAHKFVLSVGSAVFDAMFNGAMATQSQEDDDIELPDVEPAAFIALLKFLYSDDVQIGPESVMTTLYTAKKYAVPALENHCVEFLKKNLNADNSFMLLTQARLFDEPQLAALCLEMIDKHTSEALAAEGFTDIDLETLCAVLERDTLRIREALLYSAVVRWSIEECHRQQLPVTPENQRNVLGRALALIRFPLMTVEEFAQSAAQSGILSDREVVNLFLYFTVNPKPAVSFLDVPRCCVTGKEQTVNRFQRIEGRWGYSGTPDRIKFTVDRRIFVVGFGLYGSIHGPTEYQVTIQIIHCGTGKVLGSNDTTFSCDGSSSAFRVCFKEAIEISPCVTYIASACLKGPDSHYGTKGLRRIVHQSPSSGCVTFQFTYAAGNNNGTSVEDGQVKECRS